MSLLRKQLEEKQLTSFYKQEQVIWNLNRRHKVFTFRNENELLQHLEHYATQQDHLFRLVSQIGKKLQWLETPKNPDEPTRVPATLFLHIAFLVG